MDWGYKAAKSLLDRTNTLMLARREGFICRSSHVKTSKGLKWVASVRDVALGDHLHVYYSANGDVTPLGLFEIIDPAEHPHAAAFGSVIPESALYRVVDDAFVRRWDKAPVYHPDPSTDTLVGWAVRYIGEPKTYRPTLFNSQQTLRAFEDVAR